MIKCQVLGSGSKGNCVVIDIDGALILLDAGIGVRNTRKYLKQYWDKELKDIKAVFITHEHKDHTKIIPNLIKENVCVFQSQSLSFQEFLITDKQDDSQIIRVQAFQAYHDAFCVNYRVTDIKNDLSLLYITDTGIILCDSLPCMIEPTDIIICEMNHDVSTLLKNNTYPDELKIRIDETHLSNEQTHDLLSLIATKRLKYFCAYHLSERNNNKAIVKYEAFSALQNICPDCKIVIARQKQPTEFMIVM